MLPLKAHYRNGQIVLDEPADIAEGASLTVIIGNDSEDSTALSRELERRSAEYKSGADPGVPWSELRAQIAAKRQPSP